MLTIKLPCEAFNFIVYHQIFMTSKYIVNENNIKSCESFNIKNILKREDAIHTMSVLVKLVE